MTDDDEPTCARRLTTEEIEKMDRVHHWFELSYAQYLTIPRSVLQAMPDSWQHRFTTCLEELDDLINWRPKSGRYWVKLKDGKGRYVEDPYMQYRHGPPIPWRDGMMEYGAAIRAAERGAVAEQRPWGIVARGLGYIPKAQADLLEGEQSMHDVDPADMPSPYPEEGL